MLGGVFDLHGALEPRGKGEDFFPVPGLYGFRCRALGFSVLGLVFIGEGIVISPLVFHDSNNTNGFNILLHIAHIIRECFAMYVP